ncbi:MaoC family dehydratase [Maledivibacter halophilus]|uniref:3-hydroxybutyryl-CoA dehydratase n=1 Tax=Maledivibacter halophilus TaxID=36842 RepID=A0A1T5K5P2_9FIRM|nr:MaoC family dehydratase [Maledivibacter halophilus]SKC58900.1 3-hydroxybutyryl-CoA dehydratase [Maledivibacter halophilus]
MKGKTIKEIQIGDKAFFQKTITETDVYLYAGITGDINPAHINQEVSKNTMFKGRIAHGMLTAGLVSAVLGVQLPGPGTIYLGQELKFTAPVRFGDTIKAEVEVIERIEEKNRLKLNTICTNQNGDVVLKGVATVMPPK